MPGSSDETPQTESAGEARQSRPRRRRWRLLAGLAWMAAIGAGVMLGLAALWPDDLGGHHGARLGIDYLAFMSATFLFHAGLGMALVVLFAAMTRRWRLAALAGVLMAGAAGPEAAVAIRGRVHGAPTEASADGLTLMSANLLFGRTDPERLAAQVAQRRPDVIVFQEWTPRSAEAIKPRLSAEYPHWVEAPRDDAFGQAVCSRRPFVAPERRYPSVGTWREPQITVTVDLEGRPLRITNVHVLPPVNPAMFAAQREMASSLAALADAGGSDGAPTDVLAGDFNAVSRSAVLRRMRAAGLIEAHGEGGSRGRWRGTTWPRIGSLRWTPGIRLDHVLHGPGLVSVESAVCEDVGSDHAPIVVRLRRTARGGR